ncbi:hypothetical protein E2493_04320 [Sphingomonas parva]|uniref:Uncharacterized protein n=1 Tax=Sphingomonas parva TaxID=2555898 RepID=A0A4Y8ZWB3_9SPHN|nr:hypothetical protein [Sphingomonas parva]TFI59425.1 hypothetical protein E2493_04320 [Sphingomonas parva]
MQKFETILGSAVWMAISVTMMFAALEPVELHAQDRLAQAATAACANDAASVSLLCETSSL